MGLRTALNSKVKWVFDCLFLRASERPRGVGVVVGAVGAREVTLEVGTTRVSVKK